MAQAVKAWSLAEILEDMKAYFKQEREFIKTNPMEFTPKEMAQWVLCRLYVKQDVWEVCLKRATVLTDGDK